MDPKFRFRKHAKIGVAAAEDDEQWLRECFVDTGALAQLRLPSDPRAIVVGRTGSGKSALLLHLARAEPNVVSVSPESLALAYITNSTILNTLLQMDVKLDIFFKLLWRHIFVVEILRKKFRLRTEKDQASFVDQLKSLFRVKSHHKALAYL